jgi:hypothetical protein
LQKIQKTGSGQGNLDFFEAPILDFAAAPFGLQLSNNSRHCRAAAQRRDPAIQLCVKMFFQESKKDGPPGQSPDQVRGRR